MFIHLLWKVIDCGQSTFYGLKVLSCSFPSLLQTSEVIPLYLNGFLPHRFQAYMTRLLAGLRMNRRLLAGLRLK